MLRISSAEVDLRIQKPIKMALDQAVIFGTIMDYLQLFNNLVNLAAIDGKFTDEEVHILAERAHVWNISSDEFETAMAGIS